MARFKMLETTPYLYVRPLHESKVLTCPRHDRGFMTESLFDLLDNSHELRRWAYRRVQCGDVVAPEDMDHRYRKDRPNPKHFKRTGWRYGLNLDCSKLARWGEHQFSKRRKFLNY